MRALLTNIWRIISIVGLAIAYSVFWLYKKITQPLRFLRAMIKIGYIVTKELNTNRAFRRRLKGTGVLLAIDKAMAKGL